MAHANGLSLDYSQIRQLTTWIGGHLDPRWQLASEGCGMAEANPTVRQRELGLQLRQLRLARGFSPEQVADKLLCHISKISRIETGTRRASPRDVRDLCDMYEVTGEDAAQLMELARQARERGWWTKYDDLRLTPFIGLEQEASAITSYAMYFMPPLLQTEDYARAIIEGIARKIDPRILEQRVEARIRRQQLLTSDDPPHYRVLLDEAVLHRQVGGPAAMKRQLQRVLDVAEAGHATVQVIPFKVGAHASVDSNFDFLEFDDSPLHAIVFVESLVSHLYQDKAADIGRYREAIEYLREDASGPRDSLQIISRIMNSG
jgi:transcriptional regulator with XRE-family HTH domain